MHVIAHEYAHVQQVAALVDDEHPTVLERALIEGAAEFVAELTSGKTGYAHFAALTKGREQEIETAFVADVDQTDLSRWVDNSTMEQGNDLGYWVGYRIVKAYYQRAADKQQALREILELSRSAGVPCEERLAPGDALLARNLTLRRGCRLAAVSFVFNATALALRRVVSTRPQRTEGAPP